LRRQPRNFENVTLVARWRVHFQGFLAIFLVAQLHPKRDVLVHKNSLAPPIDLGNVFFSVVEFFFNLRVFIKD